jgi:hypothetical protein
MHDIDIENDDAYSRDELQTMVQPAARLAADLDDARKKHGPYGRVTLALLAAWEVLDEEIEMNASTTGYAIYQDAMGSDGHPLPDHHGTSTLQ